MTNENPRLDISKDFIARVNFVGKSRDDDVTRWYNYETLPQTDDFRRATVETAHIVHSIAREKAK